MKKPCLADGCPTLIDAKGVAYCAEHQRAKRREADKIQGSRHQRGYDRSHRLFRAAVLRRDPVCVCPYDCSWHLGAAECLSVATVADHFPRSKRQLRELKLDDNDPNAGRGLCARCHTKYTFQIEGQR